MDELIEDTSQFNEDFIKGCNEQPEQPYFLEFDAQYLEKFHELHNNLQFLLERMNIWKSQKVVANLHDKTEFVIHII